MKKYMPLLLLIFHGCVAPEMGMQRITNQHIPTICMFQIFNVLTNDFPSYNVELKNSPEFSVYSLNPYDWGRVNIKPHDYIVIHTKENNIVMQYIIKYSNKKNPFVGIRICYYLKGKNCRDRLSELIEPMENIKNCLINNFPEKITAQDFVEKFLPIPHQVRRDQAD